MKRTISSLLFIAFFVTLWSCRHQANKADASACDSDTVAVPEVEVITPLPAKQMPSVDEIIYSVTNFDTIHDATINDLTDLYDHKQGSFTFRGGLKRDADYGGTVKGKPSKIVKDWMFTTGYDTTVTPMGSWGGGSGWTGQPVYVKWNQKDLPKEEIIVGSLCGQVYFIDYQTGQATREAIDVTNPIKGSVSLDPTLNGNLYVGQGIPKVAPMNQLSVSLPKHKIIYRSGRDGNAWCGWGASDSSPVRIGQFLFWPGENGTIYKYYVEGDSLIKHTTLRVKAKGDNAAGVENSLCVYRNYGFFGTNHGDVYCIDLNTMEPIWHYDNVDDIDASIVCEVIDDVPYLYCGSEVDRQGETGFCHFVKLNGLTGEVVWADKFACNKYNLNGKHFDGGLYGTPLMGRGNCKDLLFALICQYETISSADLIAINRITGEVVYRKRMGQWAWSSMVGFLNEKGEQYIFAGDSNGYAYLIEGSTGEVLYKERMVNNFESSPVVINNTLVVGSRGREIYRFHIE